MKGTNVSKKVTVTVTVLSTAARRRNIQVATEKSVQNEMGSWSGSTTKQLSCGVGASHMQMLGLVGGLV